MKATEECAVCKKRDTPKCPEKQNGKTPGPNDWCFGFKSKGGKKV